MNVVPFTEMPHLPLKCLFFFLNVIKAGKGCTISWLYKGISDNWLKSSCSYAALRFKGCTLCSGWIINDWSLSIFNKNDGLCHMSLIAFHIARSLTLSQFISYDAESPQKYRLKAVRSSGLFRKLALSFGLTFFIRYFLSQMKVLQILDLSYCMLVLR